MKILFSKKGSRFCSFRIVDKERMIFGCNNGKYYDRNGKVVPMEDSFGDVVELIAPRLYDPWKQDWIEYEGLEEKLVAESDEEFDDESLEEYDYYHSNYLGNYGFKNREGEFVIKPQYALAHEFTCGLAAVNLKRTWGKKKDGEKFCEDHYGYIDSCGRTVIPFIYSDAFPFNKYGVAYVETEGEGFLIDKKGNKIPGTDEISFLYGDCYGYPDRFFAFANLDCEEDKDGDKLPIGIYDTKERKVILEPSIYEIDECSEDLICITELANSKYGKADYRESYINSKGERLYLWLYNKGFAEVEKPNKSLVSIVSIAKFTELKGSKSGIEGADGKIYDRKFIYGLYSSKEKFILPLEYDTICEIGENIFSCKKDDIVTVIELEEGDY